MRPTRVRLIDVGLDQSFDTSMSFAQSLIQSLGYGGDDAAPVAEIEFIRTRDALTVATALQAPAVVLHLMAHGVTEPEHLGFWSDDGKTSLTLVSLAEQFSDDREGIEAGVLFADCCSSAQGRFVKAIRDCIEQPITYIGAKRMISWHESTTFASAFYGAYFKDRGRGLSAADRAWYAAERAIVGYEAIVDGTCPFTCLELKPSRAARKALAR
jgi:hypothetical protein